MYEAHEYDNREIIYISIKHIFHGVAVAREFFAAELYLFHAMECTRDFD